MYPLFDGRERVLDAFESEIFPIKTEGTGFSYLATRPYVFDHSNFKILTPKQIFQRLPLAIAQVNAGNTSGNLSNEIRQIIYSLYQAKDI